MDTSAVDNSELLRTFRGTVIIGDSLTKGCTNYGYLNDSIVIAQAAIPLRESDHLFEKAIQSAPAAFDFLERLTGLTIGFFCAGQHGGELFPPHFCLTQFTAGSGQVSAVLAQ